MPPELPEGLKKFFLAITWLKVFPGLTSPQTKNLDRTLQDNYNWTTQMPPLAAQATTLVVLSLNTVGVPLSVMCLCLWGTVHHCQT